MLNDKDIDALTSLGLTILQARVYLALTHIEKATIKSIAKNANIARQDIYRLTNELQKIGIIEKIISTPAQYKAIPLEDGIKILLQRKNKENSEAQKKAIELLQRQKEENINMESQADENQFVLVPQNQALTLRQSKAIDATKTSIDSTYSWRRFQEELPNLIKNYKKALSRGVTVRLIIKGPKDEIVWPRPIRHLITNRKFKVRITSYLPIGIIGIYDKQQILITTATPDNNIASALWSDNPNLIAIGQEAFEKIWNNTEEIKYEIKPQKTTKTIDPETNCKPIIQET